MYVQSESQFMQIFCLQFTSKLSNESVTDKIKYLGREYVYPFRFMRSGTSDYANAQNAVVPSFVVQPLSSSFSDRFSNDLSIYPKMYTKEFSCEKEEIEVFERQPFYRTIPIDVRVSLRKYEEKEQIKSYFFSAFGFTGSMSYKLTPEDAEVFSRYTMRDTDIDENNGIFTVVFSFVFDAFINPHERYESDKLLINIELETNKL
jgi:hypothetical protein